MIRELSASDITKEVLLRFKAKGYTVWRNTTWSAGNRRNIVKSGVADIIGFSHEGKFVAIEVKKIGDRFSKEQEGFLQEVNKKGGEGYAATQKGADVLIKIYQGETEK